MIKNGRPYTNENGWEDKDLISDFTYDEIRSVDIWIRENIRKNRSIYKGGTSYGLKQILQKDTGIYLTNNAFKDAMLLSGYEPVDPDELNWRYRVTLLREEIYNTSPFFIWVKENYDGEDSAKGDFAKDMVCDKDFPSLAEYDFIKRYLENVGACDAALEVFEKLWKEYERART